ncbi:MAG: M14 family zinc carboxypeptidase [Fidelibacterota bacterium]
MRHIAAIIYFYSILIGQAIIYQQDDNKCGLIPDHEDITHMVDQNWGYGYDSLLVDLNRWGDSPYVLIDSLGATAQNRAIWELTITENHLETSSLKRVYIHARTHPGEEESFWVTNEIINLLLSEMPFAEFVRANCVFHIIPMFNPDGVELGYPRENANGVDIESGWDDTILEPEVIVLKNRFIELMALSNPIEVALNMHSAYNCSRYFVYHATQGTSNNYALLEQQFINGIQSYFPGGIESWNYFISWTSGTPDQYPESWWWMTQGENVMALTYEDMNCAQAGSYDSTAYALVRGVSEFIGLDYVQVDQDNTRPFREYSLSQNYPNPFNPVTHVDFSVPKQSNISFTIYTLLGQEIMSETKKYQPGTYNLTWDGHDESGNSVPTGVYILQMVSESFSKSQKLILLK